MQRASSPSSRVAPRALLLSRAVPALTQPPHPTPTHPHNNRPTQLAASRAQRTARGARVAAVAKPSSARAAAKAAPQQQKPQQQAQQQPPADAKAAQPRRAAQYSTWQAMAQHASATTSSATPCGFDESMM